MVLVLPVADAERKWRGPGLRGRRRWRHDSGITRHSEPSAMPTFLPPSLASPAVLPVLLLVLSNIFMTLAWYGHLKFKAAPLMVVILASWTIAFFEYCLAVPANRIGHGHYSAAELKTIQEVITLVVFAGFSVLFLKEPLTWNHAIGFSLICAGAWFVFQAKP
jgi:uncharacterized protein